MMSRSLVLFVKSTLSVSSAITLILAVCLAPSPASAGLKYERNIAFSVVRTSPFGTSAETRDVGGFNENSRQIYLNIGLAFDVTTGRFKAPLHGVYAFYLSFSSTMKGATTQLELLTLPSGKSTDFEQLLFTQTLLPVDDSPVDFASASVLVELKRSDEVFLRLNPGVLDASRDRPLLFTGHLLYRLGTHLYGI